MWACHGSRFYKKKREMTSANLSIDHFDSQGEGEVIDVAAFTSKGLKSPKALPMHNIRLLKYFRIVLFVGSLLISGTAISQQTQPSTSVVAERLNALERENQ